MSFASLLNKTCVIQSKTQAQGATGEKTESWATKTGCSAVACRYRRINGVPSVEMAGYQVTTGDYEFFFAAGASVTDADRIVADGKTFSVLAAVPDSKGHHVEAFCRLVTFS
jgi:head-tail adaptor